MAGKRKPDPPPTLCPSCGSVVAVVAADGTAMWRCGSFLFEPRKRLQFRVRRSMECYRLEIEKVRRVAGMMADALKRCEKQIAGDESTHGRPFAAGVVARTALAHWKEIDNR